MSYEFTMPTPEEVQASIDEGHRLRAEFVRETFGKGFAFLRSLPSRVAQILHLPAHG